MAKIKFGLKNVHYAVVTETTNPSTGVVTSSYGAVKAWPGAVNLTLDPQGDDNPFYADDGVYFMLGNNNGYQGDFESALIPEDVQTSVFGQTKDANGVITETSDDVKKYIAFMFQFALDASERRYVMYRCSLTRPSVSSGTTSETTDPQTDTVTLTATPRPDDHKVKAYVDKGESAYANWYTSVYTGGTVAPSINIEPQSFTIGVGDELDLQVSVVPADQTITWTSSASGVASVAAGKVTGESAGDAVITASITVDGVDYTSTATAIVTE